MKDETDLNLDENGDVDLGKLTDFLINKGFLTKEGEIPDKFKNDEMIEVDIPVDPERKREVDKFILDKFHKPESFTKRSSFSIINNFICCHLTREDTNYDDFVNHNIQIIKDYRKKHNKKTNLINIRHVNGVIQGDLTAKGIKHSYSLLDLYLSICSTCKINKKEYDEALDMWVTVAVPYLNLKGRMSDQVSSLVYDPTEEMGQESSLYPVLYNDKLYQAEDCDDLFDSFYSCKEALNCEGGVYVAEGMWVHPDGSFSEF